MSDPTQTHIVDNFRQIQNILDRIAVEAGTEGVFLVDESGFLIAETGDISIDRIALSALIAASFGATEEVARLLGEAGFTELIHQGDKRHLFICKAGLRHIVISIFDSNTNLGLVKLYVERAVIHLRAILDYQPPELTRTAKGMKTIQDSTIQELITEETNEISDEEDKHDEEPIVEGDGDELEDADNITIPDSVVLDESNINEQVELSEQKDIIEDTIVESLEAVNDFQPEYKQDEADAMAEEQFEIAVESEFSAEGEVDSPEGENVSEIESDAAEIAEPEENVEESESIDDVDTDIVEQDSIDEEEDASAEIDMELEDSDNDYEDIELNNDDISKLRKDLRSEISQLRFENQQLDDDKARVPDDDEDESDEPEVSNKDKAQLKPKEDEGCDIPPWLDE